MNDKDDMNTRDTWLLALYDELGDATPPADADPADEEADFRATKALLDARPRQRPDPATISAVLAAARGEAVPRGVRRDRAPVRKKRAIGLRVGAVSAVLVALIAVIGVLRMEVATPEEDASSPGTEAMRSPQASVEPELDAADGVAAIGRQRADGPFAEAEPALDSPGALADRAIWESADDLTSRLLRGTLSQAAVESAGDEAVAMLAWDEQHDVIEVHRRIERIGVGVDRGWEAPAVPLEMMPSGRGDANLQPAGQPR